MTEPKISIELTKQELTDIRVAMLGRLDSLLQGIKAPISENHATHCQTSYDRCRAMMLEGGVLLAAMKRFHVTGPDLII